jgi:hypothetical protein
MGVRGGKAAARKQATKRLTITRERQQLALPLPAEELAALLNPLIQREVATIGAIDSVMPRESHPGYVMVMHAAKLGKQSSVEQMVSMIRFAGMQPAESGLPFEPLLKLQSALARRIGTTPVLRAMRLAELEIVRAYAEAYGRLSGIFQKGFETCWHRAIKHLTVLTAHVAMRGVKPDVEELLALPMPLDRYFAHGEDRVCFRCLFDRPGKLPPLERGGQHPSTYLCAACHEEVLGDFPADILEAARHWPDHDRDMHVLERALSRPSKLKAELLIAAKLSGLAPDMPAPPMPYKIAVDASPKQRAPAQPRPRVELGGLAESPLEQAYSDALFDYDTVRGSW